jgi:alanine racemase
MDVKPAYEQPRLLISREAILHNVRLIRRQLRPGVRVCAMIKADAYGHGADLVIDTLRNFECDGLPTPAVDMLGAACLDEAMALTETSLPVLVLRPVENAIVGPAREAIEHAIRSGWVLTLGARSAADDVARIAMAMSRRAMVHVMIDTGMTRCGCDGDDVADLLARIESHSALRLVSVGTHLATADVDGDGFVPQQLRRFHELTDAFAAARNGRRARTAANSGGVFFFPGSHFDMVRPGLSLYGIDPTCRPSMDRPLRPIAKWVAPLMSILPAKKGATVGYGQTWTAPRDTRIGIVPVGYADGYLRGWGNRAKMIIHGVPVPVVGRVSMDMATIDLHDVPAAQVNDEVTIMDNDPLSPASAYALAALGGTIPYEVFTRIGSRIRRVAVDCAVSQRRVDSETSPAV